MKHFILSNNISKIIYLFIVLFFFIDIISAQTSTTNAFKSPEFTPKSPEAAAFLKYGDYPVDLSTGVPGISLPIYTIKVDDVEVPITLSYHASGIKVNQEATWVGLGWNLNAGAQIVLSARDGIDENDANIDNAQRDAAYVRQFMTEHPYGFSNNLLTEFEKSKVKDVYSFSSPTANGNFYLNEGVPVIFPPDAFKVEVQGAPVIGSFIITDKMGNQYLFTSTTEKSERVLTHHDDYTSAWYVDEIRTSKNNKIKFTYQDDGEVVEYSESESIGVIEEGKNCGCGDATKSQTVGLIRKSNENTITRTKKIKEITFNDDQSKVEFELKKGRLDLINQNGYLESVKISQKAFDGFNIVKKVSFEYSYFNNDFTGVNAYKYKRLKLDRMYENNNTSNSHRFVYSDLIMPAKDSKSQDYYGYNNGAGNTDLIPKHILTSPTVRIVGSADRSVNSNTIEIGILKHIFFPTKGSSKFTYEPNTFYGVDQLNKYAIKNQDISLTGKSAASNPAPPQLEGSDGEQDFEGENCSGGNCLKYKIIHRQLINPKNNYLTYTVNNNGPSDSGTIKYKYCRVYVYSNGLNYDSGKKNINTNVTVPISLSTGECTIVLEAYGDFMSIGAHLNYMEEDMTPKNLSAAGLRVISIENFDYDNTLLLRKTYSYNDFANPSISSGKLINELSADFISGTFANFSQGLCPSQSETAVIPKVDYSKGYYITSRSKQGIESNTVVYKNVSETVLNSGGAGNFYTEYDFTTVPDWTRPDVGLQINYGWKRGKILEKREYKSVGNSKYLVRKESNDYFEDDAKTAIVKGYKLERRSFIDVFENSNPLQQPAILTMLSDCQVPQGLSTSYVLAEYNIPIPWYYQKSSEVSEYFYNISNTLEGKVENTTTFNYNNPLHLQLSSQKNTNSKGEVIESKYYYPQDSEMAAQPFINELKTANRIGVPLKIQNFKAGNKLSEQLTVYDKSAATGNLVLPNSVYVNKGLAGINLSEDKKITYDLYDDKGNILQYTTERGIPISIVWGYNRTQPIAKIENIFYSAIPQNLITAVQAASDSGSDLDTALLNALDILRNDISLNNTMVSTYTFKPMVGVSTVTDTKGFKTIYEYDAENRLKVVRDSQGNILSENQYHYKN